MVISGGGTGGHLYPAIAVCQALLAEGHTKLAYVGHPDKAEAQKIPALGIPFYGVRSSGMPRGRGWLAPFRLALWVWAMAAAVLKAYGVLYRLNPRVVFATGGYTTAPVILAALLQRRPYVVHEPDARPGLVNLKLASYAAAVTCAFEAAKQRLGNTNTHVTGNPLRGDIGQIAKADGINRLGLGFDPGKPVLLVVGGSQGAARINQAVVAAVDQLTHRHGLQVLHQTGDQHGQAVMDAIGHQPALAQNPAYKVLPFIEDMSAALAAADVAVCRAGSMTLSEMIQANVPMVLVPYPYAAGDHQRKNAQTAVEQGVALMIEDAALDADRLISVLDELLENDAVGLHQMKAACKDLARPDAAGQVVALIQSIAHSE
ncbi:MAG: undecaprenyldiphospho-muramoylpentapeptide beta-N-acetylglucosaminyltransferase [Cyanobacteria bacterium HKST-UBA06]|nr:undecaprenyldiphospho-muramoylpentapeptide beta-N-acetylglucosaminyltransferase [Cyanobacteria bacterium HKST-UBA06]